MRLIWTDNAKEDYATLLMYIETEYGLNAAEKLFDKVEKVLETIERFPKIFPFSKQLNGHKAVVSKQTSIIYIVSDNDIFLLQFSDNRMN